MCFDKKSMKDYINVQTLLREAGVSTEIYPEKVNLKNKWSMRINKISGSNFIW